MNQPAPTSPRELEFTGERLTPAAAGEHVQMLYEHLHRYHLAAELCSNKVVLDIACGEGYGANLLGLRAKRVIGVDQAATAIQHASAKYDNPKLQFLRGSCEKIPLDDAAVDVVVSFETIEHIDDHKVFLREIRRVLKPNGIAILSTPDKAEYTDRMGNRNSFHVHELYKLELLDLLQHSFRHCLLLSQRLVGGSWIAADALHSPGKARLVYGTHRGDFAGGEFTPGIREGVYAIAICSNAALPVTRVGLLEGRQDSAQMWDAFEQAPRLVRERAAALERAEQLAGELGTVQGRLAQRENEWTSRERLVESELAAAQLARQQLGAVESLARAHEGTIVDLRKIRDQLGGLVGGLADQLKAKDQVVLTLTARHDEAGRAAAELRDRVTALAGELAAAGSAERALRADHHAALAEIAVLRNRLAEAATTFAALDARHAANAGELAALRDRTTAADGELAAARAGAEQLRGELASVRTEAGAARQQHDRTAAALELSARQAAALVEQNQRLSATVGELEGQLGAAQAAMSGLLAEGRKAVQWAAGLDRELRETRDRAAHEIARLADKVARMGASASWQLTMPLRAARRLVLDRAGK